MKLETMMQTGKALGAVRDSGIVQHPALRLASRYWWISIPTGLAFWSKVKERREKGVVKLHHWFAAAAEVLGPIMTVVTFMELAERMERKNGYYSQAAPASSGTPIAGVPAYTEETPYPGQQRAPQ